MNWKWSFTVIACALCYLSLSILLLFQLHFKFFGICWPQQVVWYFTLSWHSRCWMGMNLVFAPGSSGVSSERGCMDSEADIQFQFLCVTLKKSPSLTSTFLALRGMWCTRLKALFALRLLYLVITSSSSLQMKMHSDCLSITILNLKILHA